MGLKVSEDRDPQQTEEPQKVSAIDKYRAAEIEMVRRDTELFYKELVEIPAQNIAKLPEVIFVNVFLPYFRGDKNFSEHPNLLSNWYAIAGSISNEVAIIDEQGRELYRVPPYVNSRAVDPTHNAMRQDMSFYDIDGVSEGLSRSRPGQAMRFRAEKWDSKMEALLAKAPDPTSILGRWAEIFKRYEKSGETIETVGKTNPLIKNNTEDDLEF